ncbi:SH3 type 3 domain protein [Ancylobacter novellus DSM 506]|uniref:SH3 type 3 domain protein n=1 Tax=Ancylobacter novellus (strain ATCC 8093 / DSM 506 / JCM 20403 / CCM 1077 / IAM 12100 / NBRC 12443 / NCIMB 10456) TaxID=639283 RepID=D7A183_ANCN5|nr:SH3 domain-containing protein [Ancylobacter novellus]ADH89441.1 SH3 type 3 domain protein [Ancylobacter novellus DSM 506]
MRFRTPLALASGLVVAGTLVAGAWPSMTTRNANVRGGPGTAYGVLGTLPAGSPLDVVSCTGNWCETQYGYISAGLLGQGAAGYGAAPGYAPAYAGTGTSYGQPYNAAAAAAIARAPAYTAPAASVPVAGASALGYGAAPATATAVRSAAGPHDPTEDHPGSNTTMAGPRTTIGQTNVRSGPGVDYPVTKTLPDFTKVEVTNCANAWCQTNEGYISIYLLSRGPVQQVLTSEAQPRVPGSQTRDSIAWNAATQAAMGYGAPGSGVQGGYAAGGVAGAYAPVGAPRLPAANYARPLPQLAGTYAPAARGYAPTTAGAYGAGGGAVTTANANVRGGPGMNYGVLGTLPAGSPVSVVACTGSWCQTQYGYISARLLSQGGAGYAGNVPGYAPAYAGTGTNYRQPYNAAAAIPRAPAYAAPATAPVAPRAAPVVNVPVAGAAALGYGAAPATATAVRSAAGPHDPTEDHPGSNTTMAGPRTTIGQTNVRSGPGVDYPVTKTLPDFTKVEVTNCANAWCQTNEGYISIYLLSRGPVQQVLTSEAQPRVPGSQTRDSIAWNAATQAAMGYGAPGSGVQGGYAAGYTPGSTPAAGYARPVPQVAGAAALGYPTAGRAYAPSAGAAYGAAGTATTTANVNVRGGPGVAYGVLGTLPAGSPVNIVSCTGSWCQTQYGYVSARHVSQGAFAGTVLGQAGALPGAAPAYAGSGTNYRRTQSVPAARNYPLGNNMGIVPISPSQAPRYLGAPGAALDSAGGAYTATTLSNLNVRSGPGTSYEVLGTLPAGSPVDVVGCSGSWCQTQFGYVSARHLNGAGTDAGTLLARPAVVSGGDYSNAAYVDPALVATAPAYAAYPAEAYPQSDYVATAASLPVVETLGGIDSNWGGYGRGLGWTNWRTSWGPGYWGPGLHGRNIPSNWGARPSYWGGRTTFWNVHPGYRTRAYRGDRRGNYYWSRRGEGRLPQAASWYYGLGPRWQGPYAEGPEYAGRPVVWQPRAGIW